MIKRGILFVLSGPSGAGKGTVLKSVIPKIDGLCYSISVTTRAPRMGEVDGVSYHFVSDSKFVEMIENDEFLEHVAKFNNKYGTLKSTVNEMLDRGLDVLLEIETKGASKIRKICPNAVLIFITPSSIDEIQNRLKSRNTESNNVQKMRFNVGKREIKSINHYDYIAINDDLEQCINNVVSIIIAERSKRKNNAELVKHLLSNNKETI